MGFGAAKCGVARRRVVPSREMGQRHFQGAGGLFSTAALPSFFRDVFYGCTAASKQESFKGAAVGSAAQLCRVVRVHVCVCVRVWVGDQKKSK